jgi:hypothetical protein
MGSMPGRRQIAVGASAFAGRACGFGHDHLLAPQFVEDEAVTKLVHGVS